MMHGLFYADEVRSFDEVEFGDAVELKKGELELARQLIDAALERRASSRRSTRTSTAATCSRRSSARWPARRSRGPGAGRGARADHRPRRGAEEEPRREAARRAPLKVVRERKPAKAKGRKSAARAPRAPPERARGAPALDAEVSRILGMREARVRDLVRAGLCRPARSGRGYAFSFQDLVVLRAAKEPARAPRARGAGAPRPRGRWRRSCPRTARSRGCASSPTGARWRCATTPAAWQPATGQIVLDFAVDELAREVDGLGRARAAQAARPPRRERARAAFERALDLEDDDPEAARDAYRERARARSRARRRLREPRAPRPRGRRRARGGAPLPPGARAQPRGPDRALQPGPRPRGPRRAPRRRSPTTSARSAIDPDFADAHFNLAGLCEQLGREAQALRHYHAYKKLTERLSRPLRLRAGTSGWSYDDWKGPFYPDELPSRDMLALLRARGCPRSR